MIRGDFSPKGVRGYLSGDNAHLTEPTLIEGESK